MRPAQPAELPGLRLVDAPPEYLHGVVQKPPPVITVALPRGRRIKRLTGTRFRAHAEVQVVRRKGLPVTSAAQTVLDLAAEPGVDWREAVATAARWVQQRKATASELAEALEGRTRHPHRVILEVALGVVAHGAESVMEVSYVQRVEEPHGLPRGQLQVRDGVVRRDVEYEGVERRRRDRWPPGPRGGVRRR